MLTILLKKVIFFVIITKTIFFTFKKNKLLLNKLINDMAS